MIYIKKSAIFTACCLVAVSSRCMCLCVIQGLIFVVDSNDRERATEAREELSKMVC